MSDYMPLSQEERKGLCLKPEATGSLPFSSFHHPAILQDADKTLFCVKCTSGALRGSTQGVNK